MIRIRPPEAGNCGLIALAPNTDSLAPAYLLIFIIVLDFGALGNLPLPTSA